MRRSGTLVLALVLAWGGAARADAPPDGSEAGVAPELDGRAVMERVDARPRGEDEFLRASWRLVSGSGRERERETRSFWRDHRGEDDGLHSKRLIVFDAPAPVRDTAFLVFSKSDVTEDDSRWIYLPALRKVRRIAGGDRGKSFAGTDFSYDDLAERAVEEDRHRWLRTETREGARHYVVESVPRDDAPYARRVQYVHADRFTVTRVEYYDEHDRLQKVLEAEWQQVDGIWAWERLVMDNRERDHRTVVEVEEVRHGQGLPDDLFSESTLRFGVP